MKTLFLIFLVLFPSLIFSQIGENTGNQVEIILGNVSGTAIDVKCHPVSMVINGDNEYSLFAAIKINTSVLYYDYINGTCVENNILKQWHRVDNPASEPGFNFDGEADPGSDPPASAFGSFGRGIYKLIFYNTYSHVQDSVFFEQDAGQNLDIQFIYYGEHQLKFTIKQPDPLGWTVKVLIFL